MRQSVACLTLSAIRLPLSLAAAVLSQSLWAEELATKSAPAANLPAGPSFDVTGMIGSLLFVILSIVGLMWLLKRSRLVAATGQSGVSLVSQIPLSMKEKLIVVQVGDEKLLLGCTAAAINTLHSWPSAPDDENTKPPESAFAKLLAKRQLTAASSSKTGEQL